MDDRLLALLAHGGAGFFVAAGGHAVGDDGAVLRADADDVAPGEGAFDGGDADGEEAAGAFVGGEGGDGARVDDDGALFEPFAVGDPALEAVLWLLGQEPGADRFTVDDRLQDAGGGAVGDVHGDAELRELVGDVALGEHATTAELRFARTDVLAEVGGFGIDLADDPLLLALHVEEAVDVGEDDVGVDLHHGGDEAGELVVVGEHELGDGHGVVLVDDGHDLLLEQGPEAGAHVEVVLPVAEVPFGDEDLGGEQVVPLEAVAVGVDQADLSRGGQHLAGLHVREVAGDGDDAPAGADGSGGDEDDLDSLIDERRDLCGEAVEDLGVELAVASGDDVGADLDDDFPVDGVLVRHALFHVFLAVLKPCDADDDEQQGECLEGVHAFTEPEYADEGDERRAYGGPDGIGHSYGKHLEGQRHKGKAQGVKNENKNRWKRPGESFGEFHARRSADFGDDGEQQIEPVYGHSGNLLSVDMLNRFLCAAHAPSSPPGRGIRRTPAG